jgi:RHS repeat-associated protein
MTLRYDGEARLLEIEDRASRKASFSYDEQGRLVAARDGLDRARGWPGFRYQYDGAGRVASLTNSEGEQIQLSWKGRRIHQVRPQGERDPVYSLSYGSSSATGLYWTRLVDPHGRALVLHYDAQRRLRERENALGERISFDWSGLELTAEIDPAGVVTRWSYPDPDTRLEHQPAGNQVTTRYPAMASDRVNRDDPFERPIASVEDDLGALEVRSYDDFGRLTQIGNGAGEIRHFSYDAEQNLESITDAAGVRTVFSEYGEHGHPARVEFPDGLIDEREYDLVGNRLRALEMEGPLDSGRPGIASRSYDEDRNIVAVELADLVRGRPTGSKVLTIDYRSDGRPRRIGRPYGGDSELRYDALGRLVESWERVQDLWQITRIEHDAAGNVLATTLPNGMRREASYDAAGRLAEIRYLRDGVLEHSLSVSYAQGRLVSKSDLAYGGESERLHYDDAGRLTMVEFPGEALLVQAHDLRSRLTGRGYWAQAGGVLRSLEFGYDAADRLVRLVDQGEEILSRRFQDGKLDRVLYGNGLERSYDYDLGSESSTGSLTGSTTRNALGDLVEITTVGRDVSCDLIYLACYLAQTQTFGSVAASSIERAQLGPAPGAILTEVYPGLRVATWTTLEDAPLFEERFLHEYDELGNLTLRDEQPLIYNGERNRLLSGAGRDYEYDQAGFVTLRGGVPITWTAGGRIASIGAEAHFQWDAEGRPVRSVVDGVAVRFLFGGSVQADDQGRAQAIRIGSQVSIDLTGGGRRYRHLDHRGNVRFVSDDAGDVVLHYRYGAYGVDSVVGTDPDRTSFAQGQEIGTTGLMILGARVYDPEVARFLSPDPVAQVVNQYAYTLGNPLWFWDPDGVNSGAIVGAAAIGLGGVVVGYGGVVAGTSMLAGTIISTAGLGLAIGGFVVILFVVSQNDEDSGVSSASSLSSIGTGADAGCSPAVLAPMPGPEWTLGLLVSAQLALGAWLLRRRRGESPGREGR